MGNAKELGDYRYGGRKVVSVNKLENTAVGSTKENSTA
jgi:hypothetical protein